MDNEHFPLLQCVVVTVIVNLEGDEVIEDSELEETVCCLLVKLFKVVTEQGIVTEPLVQMDSVFVKVDFE